MKRITILLAALLCLSVSAHAAWLTNYPVEVKQPNGTTLKLFVTGDEYHHRVHDADGYTLIRDPITGYVVYAALKNDELVSTGYRYGKIALQKLKTLSPNIDISTAKRMQLREKFLDKMQEKPNLRNSQETTAFSPRTGTLNNIVVYIAFQGESFTHTQDEYYNLFMSPTAGESLYSYFRDISNGAFSLPSSFFPVQSGTTVAYYQDTHTRDYYVDAPSESMGRNRLDQTFAEALDYVRPQIESVFSSGEDLDSDGDGDIDNICFVVAGNTGAWASVLWPQRSTMSHHVYFLGKRTNSYNLIIEDHLYTMPNGRQGVLVHETYHTLGAPDLYTGTSNAPVGMWDIMAENDITPQSSSVYISNKYGRFVGDIPEISSSGTYTLYDTWDRTGNTIAYKINSPTSTSGEYFVLEYRRIYDEGGKTYETWTPKSGIIIYRINPNVSGNMGRNGSASSPYEMYVYRQGGEGYYRNAVFKKGALSTFSDSSSPRAFLSDNSNGLDGIVIDQFSEAGGETMSFRVTFPTDGAPIAINATDVKYSEFTANWTPTTNTQSYMLSVYYKNGNTKIYTDNGFQNKDVGNTVSYAVAGLDRSKSDKWYYTVRAKTGSAYSDESNEIKVELAYNDAICEYNKSNINGELILTNSEVGAHNSKNYSQYAEYYELPEIKKVTGCIINIEYIQNNSNSENAKITMKLWNKGDDGNPDSLLYSEDFYFSQLTRGENTLAFAKPTIVPTEFFIGWQIYYASENTDYFKVEAVHRGINGKNTAYFMWPNVWFAYSSWVGDYIRTSFFLFPNVCQTEPEASFTTDTQQLAVYSPVLFTNNSIEAPGTVWLWNFGDGQTSTEKNPTHTYSSEGTYTVALKASNTVGESIASRQITVQNKTSNGIDNVAANQLKIFPNPAKEKIFIKSDLQIKKVEICAITGTLLISESNFNEKISVSELPVGVYLLRVYTDNGITVSKIVKE